MNLNKKNKSPMNPFYQNLEKNGKNKKLKFKKMIQTNKKKLKQKMTIHKKMNKSKIVKNKKMNKIFLKKKIMRVNYKKNK